MTVEPFLFGGIWQKLKREPIEIFKRQKAKRALHVAHDAQDAVRYARIAADQRALNAIADERAHLTQCWRLPRHFIRRFPAREFDTATRLRFSARDRGGSAL